MTPVLIDADALHCLRSYGFVTELERIVSSRSKASAALLATTAFIAHHERPHPSLAERFAATDSTSEHEGARHELPKGGITTRRERRAPVKLTNEA